MTEHSSFIKTDGYCADPCANCPRLLFESPNSQFIAMVTDDVIKSNLPAFTSRNPSDSEIYSMAHQTHIKNRLPQEDLTPEFGAATDAVELIIGGLCVNYSQQFNSTGETNGKE